MESSMVDGSALNSMLHTMTTLRRSTANSASLDVAIEV